MKSGGPASNFSTFSPEISRLEPDGNVGVIGASDVFALLDRKPLFEWYMARVIV